MKAPAAAFGLAVLSACLDAPPGGLVAGRDGAPDLRGDAGPGGDVYVRRLEIAPDTVTEPLADFPVLVRLDGDDLLGAHASEAGEDLAFLDTGGNPLDFELEHREGNDLRAWVRLPVVAASDATVFYLRYGEGAPRGAPDREAVWNEDFAMVWHLEEEPASLSDSTAGGHDAVSVAGSSTSGDGYLGRALSFDGDADYVSFGAELPDGVDAGAALTVTAWVRYDSKTQWAHFITKASDNASGWGMGIDSAQDFMVRTMDNDALARGWNAPAEPESGTWYHWTMVFDGAAETDAARLRAFRDGGALELTFDGVIPAAFDADGGPLYIGCATWQDEIYCIDGAVDEVRVSTVARSAAWIAAEHANQRSGSVFLSVGVEEKL